MKKEDRAPRQHRNPDASPSKGLVIVHTGDGKGKSTAAFGTALRALGHGMHVAVLQFIKGTWPTGEQKAFEIFGDRLVWKVLGEGFTWDTKDFDRDVRCAEAAWEAARIFIEDTKHKLVVLDEINYCFQYHFLEAETVIETLRKRPGGKHIILTGNGAPRELIAFADLVSETRSIKHPFQQGILAQKGIEY